MATIERLLDRAKLAAHADGCVLISAHSALEAPRGLSAQLGSAASVGAFVDRAFLSNQPTLLADASPPEPLLAGGVRDALAVPLGPGSGAVVVFHALTAGRFSRDVDAVVQTICRELGVALEMRTEARLEAAERAARLAQERFEAFVNALPAAAWLKDSEGRYLFANTWLRREFPGFGDDYVGKRDEDVFPPDLSAQFVRSDASARRTGLSAFTDRTDDGTGAREWHTLKFPLSDAGGQVGGLSFEVTERQRLTRHAEASEEGFLTLAALIPDALLIHRSGNLVFVNEAAAELFELPRGELFGRTLRSFVDPSEVAHYDDTLARFSRGEGVRAVRQLITGKGNRRTVEFTARPLEFQGSPAVVAVVREFAENEAARSHAEREARLRSLHALGAAVGHHVNNPLTSVMANLSLLEQRLEGEPKTLAEEAQDGARRIRDLVRSLRMLEGDNGAHLKRASVMQVMTGAVEGLAMPGRASVVSHLQTEAEVAGDGAMLAQVVTALLHHELRSSTRDGEVTLTAEVLREHVVIHVVGDGVPLDARQRERLFEPFSVIQLPTGLELSIAWALIRAFGGELKVGPPRARGNELLVRLRRVDVR